MHKSQVFFYLLLSFIVGVFIASFRALNDQLIQLFILCAAAVMGISAYRHTFAHSAEGVRRRKIGFLLGCMLLVAALGVYRFTYVINETGVLDQLVNLQIGKDEKIDIQFNYVGYVAGDPEIKGDRQQFSFRVKRVDIKDRYIETDEL